MNKPSKLAAELAGTLIVASLLGTSAFAESRHHDGTQSARQQGSDRQQSQGRDSRTYSRGGSQSTQNYDRQRSGGSNRGSASQGVQPQYQQRYDRSNGRQFSQRQFNNQQPTYRQQQQAYRGGYSQRSIGYDQNSRAYSQNSRAYSQNSRGYTQNSRGYTQNTNGQSWRGSSSRYSYPSRDGRSGAIMEGRISRLNHERGGYRVWLDRGGYSYWVPEARFGLWPLRVGLSIRFGGWWNPLGYYDVYDMGPNGGPFYTSGDLRGVVENVDYRTGMVVLRDDVSGTFVTALLRGGDPRLGDLRPGDYVDLAGSWGRNGYFEAYQLQDVRQSGYGNGYGNVYDNGNRNGNGNGY